MSNRFVRVFREIQDEIKGPDGKMYYGWWNVAAVFPCVIFIFSTANMMLQLMYPAVEDALNLTRAEVVTIYSVKSGTAAIVAFGAGFLIDRWGVKTILYLCATMSMLGFVFFHFVDGKWMWWLAGIPLGFSSIPLLLATKTLVARWFNRRLGLALGLAASATSISGMIFPVIFAWLIETFGWNNGLPIMSLAILFVVFPVVHFIVKDAPTKDEVSREFGNEVASPRTFVKGRLIEESQGDGGVPFSNILRKPVFWVLCVVQFFIGFVDQGFTQNVTPFLVKDLGFTLTRVAFTVSLSFILGFSSKIFFGWFFDRYSLKGISLCYVMIAFYISLAFGIQGLVTLIIFQLARGFAHGGVLMEEPVVAKHTFGPGHLGKILGTFSSITALGLMLGPITVGWWYGQAGNTYYPAFLTLVGIMLACAAAMFLIKPEYLLRQKQEQSELELAES